MVKDGNIAAFKEIHCVISGVRRSIVLMQEETPFPLWIQHPQLRSFSAQALFHSSQGVTISLCCDIDSRRLEFHMNDTLSVKECGHHALALRPLPQRFPWSGENRSFGVPLTTGLFCFELKNRDPRLVTSHNFLQEVWIISHLVNVGLAGVFAVVLLLLGEFFGDEFRCQF